MQFEWVILATCLHYQSVTIVNKGMYNNGLERVTQNTQGTHCIGKMAKEIPCQGKHREFGNFAKTQGKHREFCFLKTQKVKDIAIFAAEISIFFQKLDKSAKSVLCM